MAVTPIQMTARKSIATVSLGGTLSEKLAAASRAGFDGVEIFAADLPGCIAAPGQVRRLAANLGLRVELYQPFRDFEAVPAAQLKRNLRRAAATFELMGGLGADMLLVCSSVSPLAVDDDALAAEQLCRLADRAAARGIKIAYEALAWGRHVRDYAHAWKIVAAAGHPRLGLCLDSFHVLSGGADPAGIRELPGEKIFFVQLADAPRLHLDVLQLSRHHRCFPGQGELDVGGFLDSVMAAGYQGPLSLEIFSDILCQADPARTAADGLKSLIRLEERGELP
jgi:4-hydroxyphenylpyruvate dioxygenase